MSTSLGHLVLTTALVLISGSASFALARRARGRTGNAMPVAEVFAKIALLGAAALLALLAGDPAIWGGCNETSLGVRRSDQNKKRKS